jgi:hypothetical protein
LNKVGRFTAHCLKRELVGLGWILDFWISARSPWILERKEEKGTRNVVDIKGTSSALVIMNGFTHIPSVRPRCAAALLNRFKQHEPDKWIKICRALNKFHITFLPTLTQREIPVS